MDDTPYNPLVDPSIFKSVDEMDVWDPSVESDPLDSSLEESFSAKFPRALLKADE